MTNERMHKRAKIFAAILLALEMLAVLSAGAAIFNFATHGAFNQMGNLGGPSHVPTEIEELQVAFTKKVYEDSMPGTMALLGALQGVLSATLITASIWMLSLQERGRRLIVRLLPLAIVLLLVNLPLGLLIQWRTMQHTTEFMNVVMVNSGAPDEADKIMRTVLMAISAGGLIVGLVFSLGRGAFYAYCWVFFKRLHEPNNVSAPAHD